MDSRYCRRLARKGVVTMYGAQEPEFVSRPPRDIIVNQTGVRFRRDKSSSPDSRIFSSARHAPNAPARRRDNALWAPTRHSLKSARCKRQSQAIVWIGGIALSDLTAEPGSEFSHLMERWRDLFNADFRRPKRILRADGSRLAPRATGLHVSEAPSHGGN